MAQYLGLDTAQARTMTKLLDRKGKLPEDVFYRQVDDIFSEDAERDRREKVDTLLAAKSMADLPAEILESSAIEEIRGLFTMLEHLNITNVVFDITLMRGLDYYTGMVFEVFDTDPENNRSLFGGGRYDGLVGLFGVEPISSVGMAPGLTTTELFLRSHNLLPETTRRMDAYVITLGNNVENALVLASKIRDQGWSIEVDVTDRKFDKQLKTAIRKNPHFIIFVGDDEVAANSFTVKDIDTGTETKVSPGDFTTFFTNASHSR
jgi:histidyl-tRNA synthetase